MVFSSLIFIFKFLPLTLLLYYIAPKPLRNLVLLIASLVFYGWGEPLYIILMIFTTVFDYICGLLIHKYDEHIMKKKIIFILSVIINLGILSFFKYYGFLVDNINNIFGLNIVASKLPLPVGISFYTFQTMSYVIDVYLKKVQVQRNIISFGTYVTMFPQLVAGPIVKYGDVEKQLKHREESLEKFSEGAEIFIIGLAKKVVLANNIGLLWRTVKATSFGEITVLSAWIGIIAFTFQIYFDFSGYSDMAIGLGKMFGFELMKNFNYPYISKSVSEFWRRWHISLGDWFREYVYIPLGGNRCERIKQYRNLFIVWFLTGLWHGANWNFIFWGLYFGFFITLEKMFLKSWLDKLPRVLSHIYTLLVVIVGWVFFEFESLSGAFKYIGIMFGLGGNGLYDKQSLYFINTNLLLFIAVSLCSLPLLKGLFESIKNKRKGLKAIAISIMYLALLILSTTYLVNESYNPFLYFRF